LNSKRKKREKETWISFRRNWCKEKGN